MGNRKTTDSKTGAELKRLLGEHGIDLPTVRRNCLYTHQEVRAHELDLTPVMFNPDLAGAGEPRRRCGVSSAIDLGGWATTDDNGRRVWQLSHFVCDADSCVYRRPVSFVATPLSETPVSVTVSIRSTGSDLIVDVFSWNTSGAAAPRVAFSWRCWVEANRVVSGPGPLPTRQARRATTQASSS